MVTEYHYGKTVDGGLNIPWNKVIPAAMGIGLLGFAATRYRTSHSNQWLVRTGIGVTDMEIAKKFVHWPFQNIQTINMTPQSFKFAVNAMSREKMEFNFPAVPENK